MDWYPFIAWAMRYVIGMVIGVESVWKVVSSVDSPIILF